LTPFYEAIAWLVVHIHKGVEPVISDKGWSWALSIVLLTVAMRLLLFPLFVKQIRNQRAMQTLQPKMKELQAKYKNDKERLNQEMMALWREHGTNPLAGCLPLLVQIPIFFALFQVLNHIKPDGDVPPGTDCTVVANYGSCFSSHYGIDTTTVGHFANAKIFDTPISAAINSSTEALQHLAANATSTKVLGWILVVLMAASTFWTQRQMLARSKASGVQQSDQMQQTQKILLYVLPLTFFIFGYRFPIGVLLYWLTTNLWSMGQQHFVIARMDATAAAVEQAKLSNAPAGPAPGAKPTRPATTPTPTPAPAAGTTTPPAAPSQNSPKPGGNRRPNNRSKKKRRR
jgi:YidC/Oxa1 family membrane protein insertase